MDAAWLVRPSPHNILRITEFLDGNFAAIGWPCIGDLTGKSREQIKELLAGPPYRLTSLELGNAYATVDLFINQIDVGDYVLCPNKDDIHLGRIESGYYLEPSADTMETGFSHRRRVKWLRTVHRETLPMSLRKSLKVHRTAAALRDHAEVIAALAEGEQTVAEAGPVAVSYPLRPGVTVSFHIPADITSTEAQRMADFIKTLYFR